MQIRIDPSGSVEGLAGMIASVSADPAVGLILVLACDANGYTPANLDPVLRTVPRPLAGGIFPRIVAHGRPMERGTIVLGMNTRAATLAVRDIGRRPRDLLEEIDVGLPAQGHDRRTMFVFVDGLSSGANFLVSTLFDAFGLDLDFVGGGAGSMSLRQTPCVLTNEGLLEDAAVIALTSARAGIGVTHGWSSISAPFKVTRSNGSVIHTLDWKPAFDVYREVVEGHSGQSFDHNRYLDLAKAYPFGIARLDAEMVVRDPLSNQGSSLICVGDVPEGSYVHVLHGDHDSLLRSAARAGELALSALPDFPADGDLLLIDCIARLLFLEQKFEDEIQAAASGRSIVGALTLGEIAKCGSDSLEFFNKTSVVAAVHA